MAALIAGIVAFSGQHSNTSGRSTPAPLASTKDGQASDNSQGEQEVDQPSSGPATQEEEPSAQVQPDVGEIGATVTITGSGFEAHEKVRISFIFGVGIKQNPQDVKTSAEGTFTVATKVPAYTWTSDDDTYFEVTSLITEKTANAPIRIIEPLSN